MFKIGDYAIYKRDVCKIEAIKEKYVNDTDYYVLKPLSDSSLTIDAPVTNSFDYLRPIVDKKEIENIIKMIPEVPIIESNDKLIENEYKKLLGSKDRLDLVRIIKTTYLRNKERLDNDKKIGDRDDHYFKKAEQYLYNEFSVVLNMSFDETKKYILDQLSRQ